MADAYELEYKKVHNTLQKDAPANTYGNRIGQKVANLLYPMISEDRSLISNYTYDSYADGTTIWRDNKNVTRALSYDFVYGPNMVPSGENPGPKEYIASPNIPGTTPVINSDFFTPYSIAGTRGSIVYTENYRKGWYRSVNVPIFCPWTLAPNSNDKIPSPLDTYKHDFRAVFNEDFHDYVDDIYGSNASHTYLSHKILLEQNTEYVFQMVNRYNIWPDGAKIFMQFMIENPGKSFDDNELLYCQPVFKPILLENIDPKTAFCVRTPTLPTHQYHMPVYEAQTLSKQLRLRGLDRPPRLYVVFYITNVHKQGSKFYLSNDDETKFYDLDDYRFFFFKSTKSFTISEDGTILSYESLIVKTLTLAYGSNATIKTVYNDIRPILNRTRPYISANNNNGDPYVSVRFTTELTIDNVDEFKQYFSEYQSMYYIIQEGEELSYVSIIDDWKPAYTFSTDNITFEEWDYDTFINNLKTIGRFWVKKGNDPAVVCGYDSSYRYSSSVMSTVEIVDLLKSEGYELVLIPFHDLIFTATRNREWDYVKYTSKKRHSGLEFIDSTNYRGKRRNSSIKTCFRDYAEFSYAPNIDLDLYYQRPGEAKSYVTGWKVNSSYSPWAKLHSTVTQLQIESTSTRYMPYVHLGALRFPVFYNDSELEHDSDLEIRLYVQPSEDSTMFRPKLYSQTADFRALSGYTAKATASETKWNNKKISGTVWWFLDFTKNTAGSTIETYDRDLIAFDESASRSSIKTWYYKADGMRQPKTHKPKGLKYTYRSFDLFRCYKHGFLANYERSFLPWVARLRRIPSGISVYDTETDHLYGPNFSAVAFRWGLVKKDEAMQKYNTDSARTIHETNPMIFGDRYGMWGNLWVTGWVTKRDVAYTFPFSRPLLISQFVGCYPETDQKTFDGVSYNGTEVTYTIPGRRYSKLDHVLQPKNQLTTADISPFCWGAGTLGNVYLRKKNNNHDLYVDLIAVLDYHDRDDTDKVSSSS